MCGILGQRHARLPAYRLPGGAPAFNAWLPVDARFVDAWLPAAAQLPVAARLPTYVTIKEVKHRWGHGQEDVFPVSQTEKLWGDMTSLPDVNCGYVVVPRLRGQQLKDVSQLDPWVNDGSLAYVRQLCEFP